MSTLTLPLDKSEIENMEKLKCILTEKTSAGVIRRLIKEHESLLLDNAEIHRRLKEKNYHYDKLRDVASDYFQSMHGLMRECEFEQK